MSPADQTPSPTVRQMSPGDAFAVRQLFQTTPFLVPNSLFAYHLFAGRYASCTAAVTFDGQVVAALVGLPVEGPVHAPARIYVWQIAVDENHRRRGLGTLMLDFVRAGNPQTLFFETTVSSSNPASRGMFERFAARCSASIRQIPFDHSADFPAEAGVQDREDMFRIGPVHTGS